MCLYIHKSLKFDVRDNIDIFNESVETLSSKFWIQQVSRNIKISKFRNIVITAAYLPPKRNNKLFKDFCKDFLNKQEISNKAAFLLGDFNLNALDYDTNEVVKNLFNLVFQNEFLPLIRKPTRITRTSATAIDHILTYKVLSYGIIKTGISDHFPVFTGFKTNETCSLEKTKSVKRGISSENIDTFKFLLENIKWDNILPAKSPDKAYETFYFIFSDFYGTAFPKRKFEIKNHDLQSPGITRGLQKSSKRMQRPYEKFLKKEQLKMKLYVRSISIYLKKLKTSYQRKLKLF